MFAGGSAGLSHVAQNVAAPDAVSGLDFERSFLEVEVFGHQPVTMVYRDMNAGEIVVRRMRLDDSAVAPGAYPAFDKRGSCPKRAIDARMEAPLACYRMDAPAVWRSHHEFAFALEDMRPETRCGRYLFLSHVSVPAFFTIIPNAAFYGIILSTKGTSRKMKKTIVAAQLFSLRDFTQEAKQLPATFAKVKKIGYDYAQVSGVRAQVSMAELRKIMLDKGVEPIGAHINLDLWRGDNLKKTLQDCHDLGVSYAAIPWMNFNDHKDWKIADWKKLFREFDAIAKAALKEGIHLQYHNHDFEFNQLGIKGGKDGKAILELLFETTSVLQAEPDFGWVMRGGQDPVIWAQKMKGRMDQVHLKDWSLIGGEFCFRAIGQGRINWPAVIKECKKGGTHTFIVEQDSCKATNDPFKSMAISREYLRGILG